GEVGAGGDGGRAAVVLDGGGEVARSEETFGVRRRERNRGQVLVAQRGEHATRAVGIGAPRGGRYGREPLALVGRQIDAGERPGWIVRQSIGERRVVQQTDDDAAERRVAHAARSRPRRSNPARQALIGLRSHSKTTALRFGARGITCSTIVHVSARTTGV